MAVPKDPAIAGSRPLSLGALRRATAARLRKAEGVGTPDLDARVLTAFAAGIAPSEIALRDAAPVGFDMADRLGVLAGRRIAGEPVARITGRKEFWGLDLALSAATLVPRPDTETLVEAALAFAKGSSTVCIPLGSSPVYGGGGPPQAVEGASAPLGESAAQLRILDLGTGSGAILLALLSELPAAAGVGIDIAPAAVATARANAAALGLGHRTAFHVGNWDAAPATGPFDLVVSNPPYIPTGDIAGLAPEVREHDPLVALDGGADGLAAIRAITALLPRLLHPQGAAFIEIGVGQAAAVAVLAAGAGFTASFIRDLAGIDRVVTLTGR